MTVQEDMDCSYIFCLPTNARLKAMAAPWAEDTAVRRASHEKDSVRRFYQARYAARSWRREHRIVARVEARRGVGVDTRFIVTQHSGR